MNALTYELRNAAAAAKTAAPAKPAEGFWKRLLNAMIEARMRQAERQVRMHFGTLPARADFKVTYKDAEKLPFVK